MTLSNVPYTVFLNSIEPQPSETYLFSVQLVLQKKLEHFEVRWLEAEMCFDFGHFGQ